MLKLIPNEGPEKINKIRKTQRKKIKGVQKTKGRDNNEKVLKTPKCTKIKITIAPIVKQRDVFELEKEKGIIKTVCAKLIKFIRSTRSNSIEEINETIHALQKSILSLERHRHKLLRREKGNRKRK